MALIPYAITKRTNPSAILEVLLGASAASSKKEITAESLINRLVKDFREEISEKLPVFYLIDSTVIYNELLSVLDPSKSVNLSNIFKVLKHIDLSKADINTIDIYGDAFLDFNAKSWQGTKTIRSIEDLYTEAFKYLTANADKHIRTINTELRKALRGVEISTISTELQEVLVYFNSTIADLVNVSTNPTALYSQVKISSGVEAGRVLRKAFANVGSKSYISDAHKMVADYDDSTMTLVASPSYNLATTNNHNNITKTIKDIFSNIPVNFQQLFPESNEAFNIKTILNIEFKDSFKIGDLVAAGHAAVRSSNQGIIGINTPLLQVATLILQANNRPIPGLVKAFIDQAGHTPDAINITESFSTDAESFISAQISFLRSQPERINSGQISPKEVSFFDSLFNKELNKSWRDIRAEYLKRLSSSKVITFFTETFSLSPTMLQHIENIVAAELIDDSSYKGNKAKLPIKVAGSKLVKRLSIGQTAKAKKITPRKPKVVGKAARIKKAATIAATNLISLQNLINTLLHQQIRQNMGDGNRRDVLNYQTGRFAQSAQVERLTQGRAGMITAYYTYMKYPYATFSEGGQQEFPRSRDPKLLISQSIREIAQQQMITRMRAQLI